MGTSTRSDSGSTATKLHFSRFEFKYVLPKAQRDELETQFQYFVELDPFVAGKPDAKYLVRSLYFDNELRTHYWEKQEGVKHRQKFRIRTYTDQVDDGTPRFLEIKGRHNNLVFKHRTPLPALEHAPTRRSYYGDATTDEVLSVLPAGPIREQFEYDLDRRRIRPVTLIDYRRRPYISKFDPEFRMTFDDELRATASNCLFPSGDAQTRQVISGYTILEVKFRFHLPKWFHRLIQSTELRRVSISKFCAGMKALGQVDDPD